MANVSSVVATVWPIGHDRENRQVSVGSHSLGTVNFCKSILLGSVVVVGEAAVEVDVEGVECGFPAADPGTSARAGGVQAHQRHVEALHGGLLVGEVAAGVHGPAQAGVDG